MGVKWVWLGLGGRANIDPDNRWRDLDQIWYARSAYTRKLFRLCGYEMSTASGRDMGVAILTMATSGWIFTKFGIEVPHAHEKVICYAAMLWA